MPPSHLLPPLRRAMTFARAYRLVVWAIFGLALAVAGLNAVEPLVLKYLFDGLGRGGIVRPLLLGLGLLALLLLLKEGASALSSWLTWRTRLGIHYALLGATVERLQALPLSYHRQESVGAIMTRLDRGIQGFLEAVSEIAFNVLPALVYLAISLGIMLHLDWRLALVVLFFTPWPVLISLRATPELIRRERTLLDRWTRIYSRFNEVLHSIATVKSFVMEETEKRRFLKEVDGANRVVVRGVGIDARVGAAQNLTVGLARIAALAAGGWLVLGGEITLGTLVAFLGYLSGLFAPVQGLSGIYKTLRTASVSLETIFSILDQQNHLEDAPDAVEVPAVRGAVFFEHVRFGYGQGEKTVLKGIHFQVAPGERVALVGPSGAGKSTLMALLQRLYDPLSGTVRVDGIDLRRLKQQCLRRQIGLVPQEPLLFNDTVRNNIAYGKPEASRKEVVEAARIANAHDFILRLPQGYETVLRERGGRLSAGERQRIAIARALLKNPPILILDEATSALDAETEGLLQEALERLLRGRTTFIIAHRLSTVASADRILVLKDGRIIEEGKHAELMTRSGYYASLVFQQTHRLVPLFSPYLAGGGNGSGIHPCGTDRQQIEAHFQPQTNQTNQTNQINRINF